MRTLYSLAAAVLSGTFSLATLGAEAQIESVQIISNKFQIKVHPDDETEVLRILVSTNLSDIWKTNTASSDPGTNSALVGQSWSTNVPTGQFFFVRAEMQTVSSNRQLAAHVLNRLAYGHTPYELGQILGYKTNVVGGDPNKWRIEFGEGVADGGIGVDAWIAQQLNPASITEDVTNQFNSANGPSGQTLAEIYDRFGDAQTIVLTNQPGSGEFVGPGTLSFADFRAYYAMHAVGARRQLHEVLLHWLENHFVSQWTKARETFQGSYNGVGGDIQNRIPTKMEAEEHKAYRAAMMNPLVTFKQLLRLQHESTSMTVYLDTNDSAANGNSIANENYAREIQELYCMGVDNGYDQGDITAMSVAWGGWDVRKVAPENVFNLYAHEKLALTNAAGSGANSNTYGVFALQFNRGRASNRQMRIWYERDLSVAPVGGLYPNGAVTNGGVVTPKTIPGRFNGSTMTPAYNYTTQTYGSNTIAGKYGLFLPATANANNDATRNIMTNKAYVIMDMLADLPFTQEYISVKLCQLLVHDDFHHGYDFSDGVVTPEEQLVWNCMLTWQTNSPKGQIYKIVQTITDSELFRSKASFRHKLKTPLEFTVSAVRALRTSTNETYAAGSFSANTEGYSMVCGTNSTSFAFPLARMGAYHIFDRGEPDGYPETGTIYVGASGLAERVRWIHSILPRTPTTDGIQGGNRTRTDPVGVLNRFLGPGLRGDADAVARLFATLIYPGESAANLDEYRRIAIDALNTADDGQASTFSTSLTVNTYQDRVRRMVATLMSMPRFNEQ